MPLPTDLPPVTPFDLDLLPMKFRPYVEDIAERMQAPPEFAATPLMTASSSVIGRQLAMKPQREGDWIVVSNLWGMLVGRPSVFKTPMTQAAFKFITRLEIEAKDQHDSEAQLFAIRERVPKAKAKEAEADLKRRIKAGESVEQIVADLAEEAEQDEPPTRRRYMTNDCTVEMLQVLLQQNPVGILLHRDEPTGWLRGLEKEGREAARAFFIEAWNGNGRFSYDTISRGTIDIAAACVSVSGNIQPGP